MSTPMAPSDSTRHGHITPANHGPYVVVASYVMMCMMLLLVMTRLITKYLTIRTLRLDDLSIIAAAVRHPLDRGKSSPVICLSRLTDVLS